jgi:PAS domain-containing protein
MAQKEIEVILLRQLASYLAVPMFIVDREGALLFCNEPAETILGLRFEETGEMSAAEWATKFTPVDESGRPLPAEILPLGMALARRQPSHGQFWILGLDKMLRHIAVTALPLIGQSERHLGAVAVFWEIP